VFGLENLGCLVLSLTEEIELTSTLPGKQSKSCIWLQNKVEKGLWKPLLLKWKEEGVWVGKPGLLKFYL
jgi:hypothetical protein